jgi:TolB-like protein/DNA-binding winged helix-turn-helix (wHTH) protein/tetratricopeptide (TPR) repeat protein
MDLSVGETGQFGFGPFLLDPVRRRLTHHGEPVKLTPTRFDTLHYLVANAGRVVEKDELLAAIWPGRLVEEANLTQTIFQLRHALQEIEPGAENYIATAPGRGYRFAESVRRHDPSRPRAVATTPELPAFVPSPALTQNPARQPATTRFARHALLALALSAAPAALLAWLLLRTPPAAPFNPPPHSVAVMAFTNIGGSAEQNYFADGISEELIDTLARIDGVRVAGRLSAFSFKGRNVTIPEIARALNVRAVLEGSVRRDGARLRITARLVDGITGYQMWQRTDDRTLADTLALQTEIAASVASSLEVALLGADARRLTAGKTSNPAAFAAYLRATSLLRAYSQPSMQAAVAAYAEAIRDDPNFADAYAGHSIAQMAIAIDFGVDSATYAAEMAQSLADTDHAISLAPDSALAHAARAFLLEISLKMAEADAEIRRAHELGPGIEEVEHDYVVIEMRVGHTADALAAAQHLVDLDPLTPDVYFSLAATQLFARHYEDALASFQLESALGPSNPFVSGMFKSQVHLAEGKPEVAIKDCQSATAPAQQGYCDNIVAIADARMGRKVEAQRALTRYMALRSKNCYEVLQVYAGWGDLANAIQVLKALYQEGDVNLVKLKMDPLLDPIRTIPEYHAIVAALKFPP